MLTWRWFLRCLLGSSLLFLAPADSRPPRIDIDKNIRRMLQSAAADKNVRSMLQSVGRLAGSSHNDQSANDHLKRQHLQHLLRQALTFLYAAATTPLPKLDKDNQNRLSDKDFDDLLGETTGEYFDSLLYDTSDDDTGTTDGVKIRTRKSYLTRKECYGNCGFHIRKFTRYRIIKLHSS